MSTETITRVLVDPASGEPIAEVHARTDGAATAAAEQVLDAYEFGGEPPEHRPIVLEVCG